MNADASYSTIGLFFVFPASHPPLSLAVGVSCLMKAIRADSASLTTANQESLNAKEVDQSKTNQLSDKGKKFKKSLKKEKKARFHRCVLPSIFIPIPALIQLSLPAPFSTFFQLAAIKLTDLLPDFAAYRNVRTCLKDLPSTICRVSRDSD